MKRRNDKENNKTTYPTISNTYILKTEQMTPANDAFVIWRKQN